MIKDPFLKNHAFAVSILIIITSAVFFNTLGNPFMWDDRDLIAENRYLKSPEHIPYIFTVRYWQNDHPGSVGPYRPLTTLSFLVDHIIWGVSTYGYHLTNIILHIINVILIYFLAGTLVPQRKTSLSGPKLSLPVWVGIPFISALLFAIHPIHTESVTWIKNRSDILASLFFLSAFLLFVKRSDTAGKSGICYLSSLMLFILAVVSKETAFTLPFILTAYTLLFRRGDCKGPALTLPFYVVMFLFLAFKFIFFGGVESDVTSPDIGLVSHISLIIKTLGVYIWLLILPFNLTAERTLDVPASILEPGVLISGIGLIAILTCVILSMKRKKMFAFSAFWFFITIGPLSNIIFLASRPIAEQRLYIPSAGFVLVLACALWGLAVNHTEPFGIRHPARLAGAFFIIIALSYSYGTWSRNRDWRSPLVFWKETVKDSPSSSRAYYNLGNVYSRRGRHREAADAFEEAVRLWPKHGYAYNNLGNSYMKLGEYEKAIKAFITAINIDSEDKETYYNLANAYETLGVYKMAIRFYGEAIQKDSRYKEAYYSMGNVLAETAEYEEAIDLFKRAIEIDGEYIEAYNNLGSLYVNTGRIDEALRVYRKALSFIPENPVFYYNLGRVYFIKGELPKALRAFEAAARKGGGADVYFNMGVILSDMGMFKEAVSKFEKSLELEPNEADAYNRLGLIYRRIGKYDKAEKYFERALKVDEHYGKAHYNIAAIYLESGRKKAAVRHALKAMELGESRAEDILRAAMEKTE